MAATVTPNSVAGNDVWGKIEVRFVNLNPAPADYVLGGYPLTPGQGISLSVIVGVIPAGGAGGYNPMFNPVTGNVQIFGNSAGVGPLAEVAANFDLSAFTFQLLIFGY